MRDEGGGEGREEERESGGVLLFAPRQSNVTNACAFQPLSSGFACTRPRESLPARGTEEDHLVWRIESEVVAPQRGDLRSATNFIRDEALLQRCSTKTRHRNFGQFIPNLVPFGCKIYNV